MPSEFELIARYFTQPAKQAVLGVGDDAALMQVRRGTLIAVSTDMLVCGTHFFADADPRRLGHKTLAVNLSDMAAMAAKPRWALLSVALPKADARWLRAFSAGFLALAREHGVELVGGDTTRGPLNLCVMIIGEVVRAKALRRDSAKAGDDVWVSGLLGDAALAVAHRRRKVKLSGPELARCARALELPQPRVALGLALRGIAHAAIDISDGISGDLGHICVRSRLGADVWIDSLPRSAAGARLARTAIGMQALLSGGDDYELCFTAPVNARMRLLAVSARLRVPLTRIGVMRRGRGVRLIDASGHVLPRVSQGYDHFS